MSEKRIAFVAVALGAFAAMGLTHRRARHAVQRAARLSGRRLRYARGKLKGIRYRLAGRHPDEFVADDVLADRVRSSLGPVEKRLDVPHVHVSVFDRIVHLHGEVPTRETHRELVDAAGRVWGVRGVRSFLHVGMLPGEATPSEGRAVIEDSPARQALVSAAREAGAPHPVRAARAVLATFMARIPEGERSHVESHLPADAMALMEAPLVAGAEVHDVRELVEAVQGTGALLGAANPVAVVEQVLAALRDLLPDEADDIAAVLPDGLRRFWQEAGV